MGIRNGIDVDIWDPENDDLLPRPYNADSVVEGKAAARETLRYRLGLTGWGDKPLVGVVTRLTEQKGQSSLPSSLPPLSGWTVIGILTSQLEQKQISTTLWAHRLWRRPAEHVGSLCFLNRVWITELLHAAVLSHMTAQWC